MPSPHATRKRPPPAEGDGDRNFMAGNAGGAWNVETHRNKPGHLNLGLVRFIARHIRPKNFMEFGGGDC